MISSGAPDEAWAEFAARQTLGPSSLALLVKLTGQVTARTSFPPPPQHQSWDREAILDFIGGMIDGKKGVKFVTSAALTSRNQASFERQLIASIENWLKDQAKMTLVGRMRRRLATLFGQDSRFERATEFVGADAWKLASMNREIWQGDDDGLFISALRNGDGVLDPLNPAGKTSARNAAILVGYSHHLLAVALGALRDQLIASLVVRRFRLEEVEVIGLHDEFEGSQSDARQVETEMLTLDARDAILAELNGRDETVLALHEAPSTLATKLNLSASDAQAEIRHLLQRLRPIALRNEIGRAALRMVIDECSRRL